MDLARKWRIRHLGDSLFRLFGIDLVLGELNVSSGDLIAEFAGSHLCIIRLPRCIGAVPYHLTS